MKMKIAVIIAVALAVLGLRASIRFNSAGAASGDVVRAILWDSVNSIAFSATNPLPIGGSNTSVSTTLNAACVTPTSGCAAGQAVTIKMKGMNTCTVQLTDAAFNATVAPYVSMDNGATFKATKARADIGTASGLALNFVVNDSAIGNYSIRPPYGGVTDCMLAVTAFTSGSAAAIATVSSTNADPLSWSTAAIGGVPASIVGVQGAVSNDATAISAGAETQPGVARAAPTAVTAGRSEKLQLDTVSGGAYVSEAPTTNATGLTTTGAATVTASVNFKASAGNLYGFGVVNGAGAGCWLQCVNSAGAGTLGTAVIFQAPLPTSATAYSPPGPIPLGSFSTGIACGVASAVNGASACGTAATGVAIYYK